jgi:hypothetical protein
MSVVNGDQQGRYSFVGAGEGGRWGWGGEGGRGGRDFAGRGAVISRGVTVLWGLCLLWKWWQRVEDGDERWSGVQVIVLDHQTCSRQVNSTLPIS